MVKGSSSKDIRYHRVDLSKKFVIDEEDSDSELERELGPPTRRGAAGSTARASDSRCCTVLRSGCIAFTVIVTLAGLTAVMIYSSILFPLIGQNHWGMLDANSSSTVTSTPTNSTDKSFENETSGGSTPVLNTTSLTMSTSENSQSRPSTNYTSYSTTNSIEGNSSVDHTENTSQADGLSKEEPILNGPDSQTFLESGFFRPKMSAESLQDDENVAELANFLENRLIESSERSDLTSKSQWDQSSSALNRDMFGNDDEIDNDSISGAHDLFDSTTLMSDSTSEPMNSSSLFYKNTTEAGEMEVTSLNGTRKEEEHHINGTYSYTHKIREFAKNAWMEYRKNDTYILSSVGILVALFILILTACFICRQRARVEAKKRHFKRLINDLNATEKFSIITPSEEEDLSD